MDTTDDKRQKTSRKVLWKRKKGHGVGGRMQNYVRNLPTHEAPLCNEREGYPFITVVIMFYLSLCNTA